MKKDEAFKWFCTFKALVENQTEKKIKVLRIDNGIDMSQMILMNFVEKLALRGRPQLHTLLSKMVFLKERRGPLWKLPTPCYVTNVVRSFYGEKL